MGISRDCYTSNQEIVGKCDTKKWTCKTCENRMTKSKMLMQAHSNGLGHCLDVKELEDPCPHEVMLVSQITQYMFIVGKRKVQVMD